VANVSSFVRGAARLVLPRRSFANSLIGAENSLSVPKRSSVRLSRELGVQSTENARKIRHENRPERAFLRRSPAKFPVNGDLAGNLRGRGCDRCKRDRGVTYFADAATCLVGLRRSLARRIAPAPHGSSASERGPFSSAAAQPAAGRVRRRRLDCRDGAHHVTVGCREGAAPDQFAEWRSR
jgi:hypothetical protein